MNAMHAGAADDALTAVILAAGSGSRLGGMPKTWRIWRGMPLWWWSVAAFEAVAAAVVLVVAEDRVDAAGALLAAHARLPATAVAGGPTRDVSSRCGLAVVRTAWVAVHDAARPLVTPALITRIWEAARPVGAAVPGVPPADTVKRVVGGVVAATVPRDELVLVQTPQIFRTELLRAAADRGGGPVTDDSAWLEAAGLPVAVAAGDPENRKVTEPADWEWLLRRSQGGDP